MKLLRELQKVLVPRRVIGSLDIMIAGVAYNSKKVEKDYLFTCIKGFRLDGHDFAAEAVARGAVAVLAERELPLPPAVTQIIVDDTRQALAQVAAWFYDYPSRQLTVIGVTGTNGKTSTTHLIKAILESNGHPVGLIGTIYNQIGQEKLPVTNTTPESLDLQDLFARMVAAGMKYVVMEVSSHALALQRVAATEFDVAVFTNLTQDHLDFHPTMEDYLEAKLKLFRGLGQEAVKNRRKYAIINMDDSYGNVFAGNTRGEVHTYAINNEEAEFRAAAIDVRRDGLSFDLLTPYGNFPVKMRMSGYFTVYNALAAAAVGFNEGIAPEKIQAALATMPGVPGRFELIDEGQEFTVVVDYAHTPDGLENVLRTARDLTAGRLIAVFGCGGDRDRKKRPLMGEVSARLSDFTVLTSDNPRSEDPLAILAEIEAGVTSLVGKEKYVVIPDRREAIDYALRMARPGDVVVIAGKGHENYQIVGDRVLPFDDREVARQCLRGMGYARN